MINVAPVILSGGSGTRLWPLSRAGFPKQFLNLTGSQSLFQQAVLRLATLDGNGIKVADPIVVSNEEHRFLAKDQLREVGVENFLLLLEPVGRNTAPALTLAALQALANGLDPVLVVTPADQTVGDPQAFNEALQSAIREADTGSIVILGVPPDRPETGYGYIQVGQALKNDSGHDALQMLQVECFVEKPDAVTAQRYLEEGSYYWNAGVFVLRASAWLAALNRFRPDIAQATQVAWNHRTQDALFVRVSQQEFAEVPAESVDYAVMEHCPGSEFPILMVPLQAGWNDLGAWDAVWKTLVKDEAGNAHLGDVMSTKSSNTLVHASSRLVALVGVENLVVIETADAVLIADKARTQEVKAIVNSISDSKREEHVLHRKVHRPWGWYDSIDEEAYFKVKRIQVKPGASLSLQIHHHRAEHWVVVKGTAEVTCGDKVILICENQSTFIPQGTVHRLANPGAIPLEIIEVQSGSYLGEDDIVRLDDQYGRI